MGRRTAQEVWEDQQLAAWLAAAFEQEFGVPYPVVRYSTKTKKADDLLVGHRRRQYADLLLQRLWVYYLASDEWNQPNGGYSIPHFVSNFVFPKVLSGYQRLKQQNGGAEPIPDRRLAAITRALAESEQGF